jgi:phosphohistidine phosphatase
MELYLVQHGEATPKEVDPERPLTARGQVEVLRVAQAAHAAGVTVSTIYHSGKLRAQQTAEILAKELQVAEAPSSLEGLSPNDDPDLVGRALDSFLSPVMLVGHLPHMSRLCSLLVVGDPDQHSVRFRMGAIVCLVKGGSGVWRVGWMLTPEVIPPT